MSWLYARMALPRYVRVRKTCVAAITATEIAATSRLPTGSETGPARTTPGFQGIPTGLTEKMLVARLTMNRANPNVATKVTISV